MSTGAHGGGNRHSQGEGAASRAEHEQAAAARASKVGLSIGGLSRRPVSRVRLRSRLPAMARAFRVHSAACRRTLLLAIVVLLLQQIALGAYACNLTPGAMADMQAMAPTSDMGRPMQRQADHMLCVKHCTPDRAVSSDARPPSMPAVMLAALPPALLSVTAMALTQAPPRRIYPPPDPPPPAILLFCSLLL